MNELDSKEKQIEANFPYRKPKEENGAILLTLTYTKLNLVYGCFSI